MSRHRKEVARPRRGQVVAGLASMGITGAALVGGMSLMPHGPDAFVSDTAALGVPERGPVTKDAAPEPKRIAPDVLIEAPPAEASPEASAQAPPDSGEGRRVVFSETEQRVWLVSEDDEVERTYLVSGSVYDNLDPGTYAVYSRSEQAWGIDDSGTMRWFVRFTEGDNAAIGFHDIPIDDGEQVQTKDDLGTPQSHGCIRQTTDDALALWEFAPIGTTVVVI